MIALALTGLVALSVTKAPPGPTAVRQQAAAIDAFWSWWKNGGGKRVAKAIDDGAAPKMADEISQYVDAIDQGLGWELGVGRGSRHCFMLTAEGAMERRILAERWFAKAPQSDSTWEFSPSLRPRADLSVAIEGRQLNPKDFRFIVKEDRRHERLDLEVYHPAFQNLNEEQQTKAYFFLLDGLIGEDAVERWIGAIGATTRAPKQSITVDQLAGSVERFAKEATGLQYVHRTAKAENGKLMVTKINVALKPLDHVFMNTRYQVRFRGTGADEYGLLGEEEMKVFEELSEELTKELGTSAIHVGNELEDGAMSTFFQAEREGTVEKRIRQWRAKHPTQQITVAIEYDPEWSLLRRWR